MARPLVAAGGPQPGAGVNIAGFYWLPPLVPDPGPFTGTFDPTRAPTVKVVCITGTAAPCPTLATLDANSSGSTQLRVDLEGQAYVTTWQSPSTLALGKDRYRVQVWERGSVIGQADLWVVARQQDFKQITAGYIGVLRGQPFTIKFRLESAGGPPPPPAPATPPSCLDCLEVVPNGVFLPGLAAQHQLLAFLVDANGVRTPVNPTWASSNPEHVVVTAAGIAVAASSVGSSQITAQANGRTSSPALAVVATPVPGALLVGDDQVDGAPAPVDPAAPYRPGWQYLVRLRNVTPAVGQIVIGTGQLPIAGRTVSATPAGGGIVDVILEVVRPADAFTAFSIKQKFALNQSVAPAAAASAGAADIRGSERVAISSTKSTSTPDGVQKTTVQTLDASNPGEVEFKIGPFECKASVSVGDNPFTLDAFSFDINPSLDVDADVDLAGFHKFVMTGSIAPQLVVDPVIAVALNGEVECKALVKTLPLPVTGMASAFIGARVGLGVGFGAEAALPIGGFGVDLFVTGTAAVSAGVECTPGCTFVGDVNGSADGSFKPVVPASLDNLGEATVSFKGFGWAELLVGGPFEKSQISLLEASIGLEQDAALASAKTQALDSSFGGSFGLGLFAQLKNGESLESIDEFLGVTLFALDLEKDFPLAKSPAGTFTITPASVTAGTATQVGETATFNININPVSYLGSPSVESVEVRWLRDDGTGTGTKILVGGRPGCTSLPASAGQTHFTCTTDFLEEDKGDQTFYAFAMTKVFGIPIPIPLEIGSDAVATVKVEELEVKVSPTTATVTQGQTQQFTATVTGTSDQSVTWSATGGSVSSTGLFTAGNADGNFTVTATSNVNPDKKGTAAVTVKQKKVVVTPNPTTVITNGFVQFTATVTGLSSTQVTWTTTAGGAISSTGGFIAGNSVTTVTVRATSVVDASEWGEATVTIAPPPGVGFQIVSLFSGGKPINPIRYRARVNNLSNVTVTFTTSAVGNGFGFWPTGPQPAAIISLTPTGPFVVNQFQQDWFADLTYGSNILIPGITAGLTITTKACFFQNGQPLLNAGGAPICISISSDF